MDIHGYILYTLHEECTWMTGGLTQQCLCICGGGDLRDLHHVGCNRGEQNGDELLVRKLSVNISTNRENLCGSTGVDRRHSQHAGGVVAVNRAPRGLIFVSTNSSSAINRTYIYCFVDACYCVTSAIRVVDTIIYNINIFFFIIIFVCISRHNFKEKVEATVTRYFVCLRNTNS